MGRDCHDQIMHLLAIAEYGVDEGFLDNTTKAVFYFWEKPHKYPELLEAYDNHLSVQGELMDERRSTL